MILIRISETSGVENSIHITLISVEVTEERLKASVIEANALLVPV